MDAMSAALMKTPSMLFALFVASVPLIMSAEDWPQYRGPHGDGISTAGLTLTSASTGKELWKTPTPNGFSSFSVAGGKAFTVVARNMNGTLSEACIALDATTGRELWA